MDPKRNQELPPAPHKTQTAPGASAQGWQNTHTLGAASPPTPGVRPRRGARPQVTGAGAHAAAGGPRWLQAAAGSARWSQDRPREGGSQASLQSPPPRPGDQRETCFVPGGGVHGAPRVWN